MKNLSFCYIKNLGKLEKNFTHDLFVQATFILMCFRNYSPRDAGIGFISTCTNSLYSDPYVHHSEHSLL